MSLLLLFVAGHLRSNAEPPGTADLLRAWDSTFHKNEKELKAALLARPDLLDTLQSFLDQGTLDQTHVWLLRHVPLELSSQFLGLVMRSNDPYLHGAACSVLERLGDCRGVAMLEESLAVYRDATGEAGKTKSRMSWKELVDITGALGRIHCDASTRVLTTLLDHPSPVVRCIAAEGLAARGEKSSVPTLISLLDTQDDVTGSWCSLGQVPVNEIASRALQYLTYECFVEPRTYGHRPEKAWLSERLRDRDRSLRSLWTTWWQRNHERSRTEWRDMAFTEASRAVEQPDERRRAFYRLAIIGDKQAVVFLDQYLQRRDVAEADMELALRTFVNLQSDGYTMSPRMHLASLEELFLKTVTTHPLATVRAAAARGLKYYPTDGAHAALLNALEDPALAAAVVSSLGAFSNAAPPELLSAFINHPDDVTRRDVVNQLNRSSFPGQEDLYLGRLEVEKQNGVRIELLKGLAGCGTRHAAPMLIDLLNDENSSVRRESVNALEAIAGQSFEYRKWDSAPDPDGRSRIEAWWAAQPKAP